MDTGENQQSLKSIIDLVRMGSMMLLFLHFYVFCYNAFEAWGLTTDLVKRMLMGFAQTGLFNSFLYSKLFALILLFVSLIGAIGKKDESIKPITILFYLVLGSILYFGSQLIFYTTLTMVQTTIIYIILTTAGFLLLLTGGGRLSRLIRINLQKDIFNEENETFPQEERLLTNEYSINLEGSYNLKGKIRRMFINVINPFRATLIIGGPGAAKSVGLIRPAICQMIQKGYCMFLYDFKFDDLSRIAYNELQKYKHLFKKPPSFYVVNFDDLNLTHRCNPLEPGTMYDITDASEAARTILLGLNREWIKKIGDFWVESSVNFVTAIIWFLRKYKDGIYCTLPHVIELMQADYDDLFPVLGTETEIEVLIG